MAAKAGKKCVNVDEKWRYCSVCRRNHDEERKHIFTKQHKNRLSVILSKFTKKVRSARRLLNKPSVLDGELEPGAKMWCYCCEREIDKHVTDQSVTLEWGGLIEHMADPVHHKKTRHFWWVNGAETTQLQMFLLFPAEYRRYREMAGQALKLIESKREAKRKKAAEEAEMQQYAQLRPSSSIFEPVPHFSGDLSREFWSRHAGPMTPLPQHQAGPSGLLQGGGSHPTTNHLSSHSVKSSRPAHVKVTAGAHGGNLTTIERKAPVNVHLGNVHSGATPPWLRDEDNDGSGGVAGPSSSVTFGPSVDEFIKHKERMRRAGKNPKRVGADFHLKLASQGQDSDDWLPSFGRVWNYGPRVNSKSEFLNEKTRISKTIPTVNALPSRQNASSAAVERSLSPQVSTSEPSLPQIKPYVRKRPRDTSDGTPLKLSKVSALNSSEVKDGSSEKQLEAMDTDSVTVSSEVKPYVRKRKIKLKQDS